jgi:DNA invertase Pin-like site-specific DNA recombinase
MHDNLVAYYRVSTQKQDRSGLGLEAQRSAVAAFAKAEGLQIDTSIDHHRLTKNFTGGQWPDDQLRQLIEEFLDPVKPSGEGAIKHRSTRMHVARSSR